MRLRGGGSGLRLRQQDRLISAQPRRERATGPRVIEVSAGDLIDAPGIVERAGVHPELVETWPTDRFDFPAPPDAASPRAAVAVVRRCSWLGARP